MTVNEAADQLQISPLRVRQLLSTGALTGRKSGRIWLVDESSVSHRLRRDTQWSRRPMGRKMLAALLDTLDALPEQLNRQTPLGPTEAYRLKAHLRTLRGHPKPAALLRSWVGPHEQSHSFRYIGDVHELLADSRVVPTGFSHPMTNLASTGQVDLRCSRSDLPGFVSDHLLIDDVEPNVIVHSSGIGRDHAGLGTLLVDLAAHAGAREDAEVNRLLGVAFGD